MVNIKRLFSVFLFVAIPLVSIAQEKVRVELTPSGRVVKGTMTDFVFADHVTVQTPDSVNTYPIGDVKSIRIIPADDAYLTRRSYDFDKYEKKTARTNLSFVPFVGTNLCTLTGDGYKAKYGVGFNIGGYSATDLTPRFIMQNEIMFSMRKFTYQDIVDPINGGYISKGTESHFQVQFPTMLKYKIPAPNFNVEFYPGLGLGLSIPVWAKQDVVFTESAIHEQTFDILQNLQAANISLMAAFSMHLNSFNVDLQYTRSATEVYVNPSNKYYSSFELMFNLPGVSNFLSSGLQRR